MGAKISLHVTRDREIRLKSDAVDMTHTYVLECTDYDVLENKPSIEGNELSGNKTLQQLGITPAALGIDTADTDDIYRLFHS